MFCYLTADKFSTGSFSDFIKAGDTYHVFNFFTNIEPTLVGVKDLSSPINSEGSFFSLGFGKAGYVEKVTNKKSHVDQIKHEVEEAIKSKIEK